MRSDVQCKHLHSGSRDAKSCRVFRAGIARISYDRLGCNKNGVSWRSLAPTLRIALKAFSLATRHSFDTQTQSALLAAQCCPKTPFVKFRRNVITKNACGSGLIFTSISTNSPNNARAPLGAAGEHGETRVLLQAETAAPPAKRHRRWVRGGRRRDGSNGDGGHDSGTDRHEALTTKRGETVSVRSKTAGFRLPSSASLLVGSCKLSEVWGKQA